MRILTVSDEECPALWDHYAPGRLEGYDLISRKQHLKLLSDIQGDANWLVRMVENLLSVTRVDDQSVKLAKHDTVLEELVDAVMVKFRSTTRMSRSRCPSRKNSSASLWMPC